MSPHRPRRWRRGIIDTTTRPRIFFLGLEVREVLWILYLRDWYEIAIETWQNETLETVIIRIPYDVFRT